MIVNILGCLFLIGMSFFVRYVAEPSTSTTIITWSMFFSGLILLVVISIYSIREDEK